MGVADIKARLLIGRFRNVIGRSRLAPFFPVNAALYLFGIVFQRIIGDEKEAVLVIDPVDGFAILRYGVHVRIDNGIHGQVQGQLAIMLPQIAGTQEMLEYDVQNFVFDGADHLLRRLFQKKEGVKVQYILCVFKGNGRRRPQVPVCFLAHLEEKVTVKVFFILHEGQAELADKGVEKLV